MTDRTKLGTRNPTWWTNEHASAWERVKAALERDWEQTKADFSKKRGQKLNQNVADTVKQSLGSEPIPPSGVKTRATDPKVAAREEEKARTKMEKESARASATISKAHDDAVKEQLKLGEKVVDVHEDLVAQQAKASEKIADAEDRARAGIAKEQAKIEDARAKRDEAIAEWQDAEQEVRYGYSVRNQYPEDCAWNDELEGKLRGEWESLATGRSWDSACFGIRRGWDYATEEKIRRAA